MNFRAAFRTAFGLTTVVWIFFLADLILPWKSTHWGIIPRHMIGLRGILLHPFLHANLAHVTANSVPLFLLSFLLALTDSRRAIPVMISISLISGSLIWLFARSAIHLGASTLVYGLATYLITAGIMDRGVLRVISAALVLILYSGLWMGIFPGAPHVSWEGHLFGAVTGIWLAWIQFKNRTGSP